MDTQHDHGQADHGHDAGHGGVGKYIAVFFALCGLTVISFLVGSSEQLRIHTPGIMWAMMMAVSCAKASLVILFFMHLKWEANWKYVLTVPASIMSVFLMLMLIPDIGLRTRWYDEQRWLNAAEPHAADAAHDAPHAEHADEHGKSSARSGDEKKFFGKEGDEKHGAEKSKDQHGASP